MKESSVTRKPLVYAVAGQSGEQSLDNVVEWLVAVYGDREQADFHVAALDAVIKKIGRAVIRPDAMRACEPGRQLLSLDPGAFEVPYGGIFYEVVEVSLFRHFDEFQGLE